MRGRDSIFAYVLSAAMGLALWIMVAMVTGKREPWDANVYWTGAYPLAVIGSAFLGYLFPEKPWRWAAMVMLMQLVVMTIRGSDLSLWPLALIVLAILTIPPALAGMLAAKLRGWKAAD